MSGQIQKPILVGGLAISAGLLGIDALGHALASNGSGLVLGTSVGAIGGGVIAVG
jgi:hypothetical protein